MASRGPLKTSNMTHTPKPVVAKDTHPQSLLAVPTDGCLVLPLGTSVLSIGGGLREHHLPVHNGPLIAFVQGNWGRGGPSAIWNLIRGEGGTPLASPPRAAPPLLQLGPSKTACPKRGHRHGNVPHWVCLGVSGLRPANLLLEPWNPEGGWGWGDKEFPIWPPDRPGN